MKLLFNQTFDSLMRAQDVNLLKKNSSTSVFLLVTHTVHS